MISVEQIQDHIPRYLTLDKQRELAAELSNFRDRPYYTRQHAGEMLQGDGWSSIEIVRFENRERAKIGGILLSNSCDIEPTNRRDFPSRIVFAPLVKLSAYEERLKWRIDDQVIANKLDAIRAQHVSSIFYLPAGGQLESEHIAILDDLHTIPLEVFTAETKREKLFTLGQMGFYLFLMKLSIHFCRFQENIIRS
jgi:hypothetical protein